MRTKGMHRARGVRALAAVAALLALLLAWPVAAQVQCVGGGCGGGSTADPLSLGNIVGTTSSCSMGAPDSANSVCLGSNAVTGEGATADGFETVLAFGDATADNTLTLKGTASGVEATVTTGSLLTGAGTGTGRVSVGGVLCKGVTATTAGTSEEVLATCTIPANTLSANGSRIVYDFFAHVAANGNTKQLRVRIGGIAGSILADSGSVTHSGNDMLNYAPCVLTRLDATHATSKCTVWSTTDSASSSTSSTSPAQFQKSVSVTWANANDLVITGTTAGAAGDIVLDNWAAKVDQ